MNSMKTYLLVWLGGVIAGVIIMERWRRTGRGLIPRVESATDGVESDHRDQCLGGVTRQAEGVRSAHRRREGRRRTGSATSSGE